MDDDRRAHARRLACEAVEAGEPLAWFERLYADAETSGAAVPWADLGPNPNLMAWAEDRRLSGAGRTALVVGCGLGDDAEALAGLDFAVVAFDIAPTAVDRCRHRFAHTTVEYVVANLLEPPREWAAQFDLVFEANTLQVLPPGNLRLRAASVLPSLVAPGGTLLVIARARDESDPTGEMPWPLTRHELLACSGDRLTLERLEDYLDDEMPPVRRFRATFSAMHSDFVDHP